MAESVNESGVGSQSVSHARGETEDRPIEAIIRHHARATPELPAITFGDETFDYRAFNEWSDRIGHGLRDLGVGEGDRVAIVLKNCPEFFFTLLATRKIGAVQVAINWRYSAGEIAWIVNDSKAEVLVVDPDLVAMADDIRKEVGRPIRLLVAGEASNGLEGLREWAMAYSAEDDMRVSAPGEVAIQLYTSGTSGWPKGALITNANIASYFRNADVAMPVWRNAAQLVLLPLFHVAALIGSLRTFSVGGHCVGQRTLDLDTVLRLIPRYRINDLVTVNTVLAMMVEAASEDIDFSSLQGIIFGGGAISEQAARKTMATFGCPLYSMYGSTELTFGVTVLRIDDKLLETPELLESCGLPMREIEIAIFDAETGEAQPEGVDGELWVRGGQRSLGYWGNPQATKFAFREDGWFRTGDIGRIRDGYLYICDRLKDMVRSGGENVYPAEVERRLTEHPDVVEAIVFGVPDEKWGEAVHALVILREGAKPLDTEIIAFARQRLAPFKCPRAVEFVTDLPRTPSGKPRKNFIREKYWQGKRRKIA